MNCRWGSLGTGHVSQEKMLQLTSPASDFYAGITFHYYVQYLLHLQLSDVAKHAEDKGVGLAVLVQKH